MCVCACVRVCVCVCACVCRRPTEAFDLGKAKVDAAMLTHAHRLLRALMLRRLKESVEKGLPPKLETVVSCPLSECQLFWCVAWRNVMERIILYCTVM